jgi:hypothetical protein
LFLWLFFQGGAAAAGEQWRQRRDNVIATGGTSRLWHGGSGVNEKTAQNQPENDPRIDFYRIKKMGFYIM